MNASGNQYRSEQIIAEMEQWNSAEKTVFLVNSLKVLSFSLVKFISTICNDMANKNLKTNLENKFSNNQYSFIMEEQANDIG